jgi:hypothetical protein
MRKDVLLDIDIDYFVKPIYKDSVNEVRLYKDEKCSIGDVEHFFSILNKKVSLPKEKHIFTNHKKSYIYWWMKRLQECTLVHIDAHSDLYDVRQMDLRLLSDIDMNCCNYLWYAIREGFIDELFWIYPDGTLDLDTMAKREKLIRPSIVKETAILGDVLDMNLGIIDRIGRKKNIMMHILNIKDLPDLRSNTIMLTTATSPEFIPSSADVLIDRVNNILKFSEESIRTVKKQHHNMLKVSEKDIMNAI